MARRGAAKPQEVEVELAFPLAGLDEQTAYLRQRPGTCAAAQNVQAFEPGTNRARGGMRSGFTPYFPTGDSVSAAGKPIQCIDHCVTNVATQTNPISQAVYAKASAAGWGLADTTGTSLFVAGAVSGFAFACSCWDNNGNLYVAEVNTTSGVVNLYAYTYNATLATWGPLWTTLAAFTAATGSLRKVAGMRVVSGTLYIAAVSVGPVYTIHQCNTASGVMSLNWVTNAVAGFTNLIYSTAAVNCLSSVGTLLGVECFGAASNKQGFMIIDTTAPPATNTPAYLLHGGTATANQSAVVSDGIGTFYTIASVANGQGQVRAIGTSGILAWTSTVADNVVTGLCFDFSTGLLLASCSASNSVRQISTADGTAGTTKGNPSSVTSWNWIDSDNAGNFTVWRNGQSSGDVTRFTIASNAPVQTWTATLANTTHVGCSVNKGAASLPVSGTKRVIVGLLISYGQCRRFDTKGTYAITGGQSFSPSAPVIFSAQCGLNTFFVDGVGYFYYNSQTQAIVAWTPATGTMPLDSNGTRATLIARWRGRIVLSGLKYDPSNYFMSAQQAANSTVPPGFDWNYSPATPTQTQAVAGNLSAVGLLGDAVTALIPYNDDTFIFGANESIWQMTGDPAAGGQLDVISQRLGMAWGQPWAIDLFGQIYFFGARSGIFKMTPGALPVRISQQIERRLEAVDYSANIIRMVWDIPLQGLRVWITPLDATQPTTNYLWEERTNAWWPVVHANKSHNPLAVHFYDGDTANDRALLIGGRDGRLHLVGNTGGIDDQTPIQSSVVLGPITTKDLDDLILKDVQATLAAGSGPVTYQIYVGRTAEQALASNPVVTGTWFAGRNPVSYVRYAGIACYVKLSAQTPWAMEKIRARYEPQGKVRRRLA